jgi:hypothetical protein
MKRVLIIFISLLIITNAIADKKNITNLNFKPSVHKGKTGKSYEIVKAESGEPVIGNSSHINLLLYLLIVEMMDRNIQIVEL